MLKNEHDTYARFCFSTLNAFCLTIFCKASPHNIAKCTECEITTAIKHFAQFSVSACLVSSTPLLYGSHRGW